MIKTYKANVNDLSPWLSRKNVGRYLDLKSDKAVRQWIEEHRTFLVIRQVGGGSRPRIRIKQSSIDKALETSRT